MKSYIPHRLLVINRHIEANDEDPTFFECMRLAFQWANDMGMQGKKVTSLHLQKPDPETYDPMRLQQILWCQIECTEEERALWEELENLNVQHAIYNMLKEE